MRDYNVHITDEDYCTDGIIHDENRCSQCGNDQEPRLWVPENQPDDPGTCYCMLCYCSKLLEINIDSVVLTCL